MSTLESIYLFVAALFFCTTIFWWRLFGKLSSRVEMLEHTKVGFVSLNELLPEKGWSWEEIQEARIAEELVLKADNKKTPSDELGANVKQTQIKQPN